MVRNKLDFPHPFGPTTITFWPDRTVKLRLSIKTSPTIKIGQTIFTFRIHSDYIPFGVISLTFSNLNNNNHHILFSKTSVIIYFMIPSCVRIWPWSFLLAIVVWLIPVRTQLPLFTSAKTPIKSLTRVVKLKKTQNIPRIKLINKKIRTQLVLLVHDQQEPIINHIFNLCF